MIRGIAVLMLGLALAGSAAAEDSAIHRSIWVGGTVGIARATEGPVFAMGGTVNVNAPVNGSMHIAGGSVELGPDSATTGDVAIAAGSVAVEGPILGDLHAAAGEIRIDGQVTGDASIAAGTLELGPHARIEGHLNYDGPEIRRDPGAQVLGGLEQHRSHRNWHSPTLAERFAHGWIRTAGLIVLAAILAAALPGASQRMANELRERPWATPLVGFVALICIPIAAVLLMVTIIGIPVALLGLALYAALLLVGYVWLAVVVGGILLDRVSPETAARTAWRVGAAMLAMLVLAILVRVPLVGGLFKLAALVAGVGMIVAVIFRHASPPARPA